LKIAFSASYKKNEPFAAHESEMHVNVRYRRDKPWDLH